MLSLQMSESIERRVREIKGSRTGEGQRERTYRNMNTDVGYVLILILIHTVYVSQLFVDNYPMRLTPCDLKETCFTH